MFHFILLPFHLIPVLFPLVLSHKEADHACTGERGKLGVPCRRGIDRNKGWGGSAGRERVCVCGTSSSFQLIQISYSKIVSFLMFLTNNLKMKFLQQNSFSFPDTSGYDHLLSLVIFHQTLSQLLKHGASYYSSPNN